MSSERFLSRWSRRKQELRETERPPEGVIAPEPASETSEATTAVPHEGDTPVGPAQADRGPDATLALPSLEDLTAEMDLSLFLREGVPEPLRNAALRRMWSLDPKIRDFVSEAREYAYDWNTPGGVPGYGPLPTSADVRRMVAHIVGDAASADAAPDAGGDAASSPASNRELPSVSGPGGDPAAVPQQPPALAPEREPSSTADAASVSAPVLPEAASMHDTPPAAEPERTGEPVNVASRRHGGAMPL